MGITVWLLFVAGLGVQLIAYSGHHRRLRVVGWAVIGLAVLAWVIAFLAG